VPSCAKLAVREAAAATGKEARRAPPATVPILSRPIQSQ
jgi:hypothetical protein